MTEGVDTRSEAAELEDRLANALDSIAEVLSRRDRPDPAALAVLEDRLAAAEDRIETAERRAADAEARAEAAEHARAESAQARDQAMASLAALQVEGASAADAGEGNDDVMAELARLGDAVAAEKLNAAQAEARCAELTDKLDAAEAQATRLRADLVARDQLVAQLRRVNAQLRDNNLALRDANARGLPDSKLINRAMLNELESIRASRDADRAEIDAVLADLKPLLGDAADA